MVLREDIWTHDTCLVCQSIHSTEERKEMHEKGQDHINRTVVYDFLSRELSCLTPSSRNSLLYQRYYRADAPIAGLDCICELNFSWSTVPFWACTICYVAGKSLESADEHMYSSFHKRNYICEYHPEKYANLLRVQEKSSKNKQSILMQEAIMEILSETQGLVLPDVYEINEPDQDWAYQKLGLSNVNPLPSYIVEEVSDTHNIVLCYICGEIFFVFAKEEKFTEAWHTHLSTKVHQRCKLMKTLVHEEKLAECNGVPPHCELRTENRFEQRDDGAFYGQTVGLENLIMFKGGDDSFCELCFSSIPNDQIANHFSSEYHIERFIKRDSPSKLLNSEYLKIEEIHEILAFCLDEKPVTTHKYSCSENQIPFLLKSSAFQERRAIVSYDLKQIDMGHDIKAIWCENCKEYIYANEPDSWNIHIFDDHHFEQAANKALYYIGEEALMHSDFKLGDFSVSSTPNWEEQFSMSMGVMTTQDHCEYGLQFIVKDVMKKKLICTCCFVECDERDGQMFSFHTRSLQHISRSMHSMNKKTMITLNWRFPNLTDRKPLILDYLKYFKIDLRKQRQQPSIYDPVIACKLNYLFTVPARLLELSKIPPQERQKYLQEDKDKMETANFVSLNIVLRTLRIVVKSYEKGLIIFYCEGCHQSLSAEQKEVDSYLTQHILCQNHWNRAKIFDENCFDENKRIMGKVSKITVDPFQQTNPKKKVTWKWNDKKASYEFVYANLGLGDIKERRNFNNSTHSDLFCTLCATSIKASKQDLEQHIRSFMHIFFYMQRHHFHIISELQSELLNTKLNIVERHKNIRRLFARALKGCEKEKQCGIPIYDFEERECEYADVKKALGEDVEGSGSKDGHQNSPTEQRSIIDIVESSITNGAQFLWLSTLKSQKQKKNISEIAQHYLQIIEMHEQQKDERTAEKEVNLELEKQKLLNVVHFDGLIEAADTSTTSLAAQEPQGASKSISDISKNTSSGEYKSDSNLSRGGGITTDSEPIVIARYNVPRPNCRPSITPTYGKTKNRQIEGRSRSRPSRDGRRTRTRSRSPYDSSRRRYRSRSAIRYRRSSRSRSRSRSRRSSGRAKSPPSKKVRESRSKSRPRRRTSRSKSKTPPEKRQPVIYTSYSKRLADLKASLSKGGVTPVQQHHLSEQLKKIQKMKVVEYIVKESRNPMKSQNDNVVETPLVHVPPPPPPSYMTKVVGGAYDSNYMAKTYPHLLRSEIPSRGNTTNEDGVHKRASGSRSPANIPTSKNTKKREGSSKNQEGRGYRDGRKDAESSESDSNASSSTHHDERKFSEIRQHLMNRVRIEEEKKKKINMHIPKSLPAFKQQALLRKKAQALEAHSPVDIPKNNFFFRSPPPGQIGKNVEEEPLQAISPEPEDSAIIEVQVKPNQTTPAKIGQQQPQILPIALTQQRAPQTRWSFVDGKFVQVDLDGKPLTTAASLDAEQQLIPVIGPPSAAVGSQQLQQQKAQQVLQKLAASTMVQTAKDLIAQSVVNSAIATISAPTNSTIMAHQTTLLSPQPQPPILISKVPTPISSVMNAPPANMRTPPTVTPLSAVVSASLGVNLPTTPVNSMPLTANRIPGANPLPQPLLGALTSALGVRPVISTPPSLSAIPPPQINRPPPYFLSPVNQPPPTMMNQMDMNFHTKMQMYAQDLHMINNIRDFIEYMWKRGYDPIPLTDPPLLFNEVLKKRRGLIGANTLYQIICYGHPELETYYCGMCNHWTTVSEMFMHLRAPMHRLNYMFRNYKMFHHKAMEEQDERIRDIMLQNFATKIWGIEGCGQCTNRMRCILNEEAISRIWPDYINCIDNSWKIMDDEDEIEYLESYKASTVEPAVIGQASTSRPANSCSIQQQEACDMEIESDHAIPTKIMDKATIRATSAQVRASLVAKKLELAEKAGISPVGLVEIKSDKRPARENDGKRNEEKNSRTAEREERDYRSRRRSPTGRKTSPRRRSKSTARSRRSSRSRSKTPTNNSSNRSSRDKDKSNRRRSRSRARTSRRSSSKEKSKKDKARDSDADVNDQHWNVKAAEFLHRIGDKQNASKFYWERFAADKEGVELDDHSAQQSAPSTSTKTSTLSLAERLANSGFSAIRKQQKEVPEMDVRELSPERPAVTPLQPGASKPQTNSRAMQRQQEHDDQSEVRRAVGAVVELSQEYQKNGCYLSAEVLFDICQEFGFSSSQVLKNEMICNAAKTHGVDVHRVYPLIVQRLYQRASGSASNAQPPQPVEHKNPSGIGKHPQHVQSHFNLKSMGVDPSKLQNINPQALQSFLSKTRVSGTAPSPGDQLTPGGESSKMPRGLGPQDIALNEAFAAPGNFVYPSYERERELVQSPPSATMNNQLDRSLPRRSQPNWRSMNPESQLQVQGMSPNRRMTPSQSQMQRGHIDGTPPVMSQQQHRMAAVHSQSQQPQQSPSNNSNQPADLHRLAMEIGDDWNSLGQFSLEMLGLSGAGNQPPKGN